MTRMRSETATLLRFLIIGGGFSLAYALATSVLINRVGTAPFATSVVVYVLCIPLAFRAQKRFAFRAQNLRKSAFYIYAATQAAAIVLVALVTTRFVTYDLFWDTVVMGVTVGASAILNFLVGRFVTFRPVA